MAILRTLALVALTACLALSASAAADDMEMARFCAAVHNESCSEQNPVPGPCTKQEKCLIKVCTPELPGSCATDPTLSWCESVDCSKVNHLVRQIRNPLGKFNGAADPRSIE